MTHALFLNDIGISHKTTTQNENVYLKGAQGLYLPVNVNNFANEVSVSKLFMLFYFYTLTREEAPQVDSWLIGTSVLVGSVLRGRRKSLKENLSTSFSNTSAGTCGGSVRKVLFLRKVDDLLKTTVERIISRGTGSYVSSLMFCEISNTCRHMYSIFKQTHVHAQTLLHFWQ